ncbi:hypothetical protein GQ457_15G020720 [Hibiscus cannabinus]
MHISAILSCLPPKFELVVAVITSKSRQQEFLNQTSSLNLAQSSSQNGVRQGPCSTLVPVILEHKMVSSEQAMELMCSPHRSYQDPFNSHRVGQDLSFHPQSNIVGYSNRTSSFSGGCGYGSRNYGD